MRELRTIDLVTIADHAMIEVRDRTEAHADHVLSVSRVNRNNLVQRSHHASADAEVVDSSITMRSSR